MSVPFSTNELLLRSDRIAFGKIPPEVPSNEERVLILPNTTGQYLYFGLSTLVSTSASQGTLEAIYPQFASFTFDNVNNRLGIGTSSPQYTLDIQTTTGVRISGGTLIASATGLTSVPTAALFSTLPTSVFAPGTIPASAFISSGSLPGVSVPTSALFSTLPTSLFAPSSIPLASLQSSGILVASSFVGDGYFLSNIPLANINGSITGNFFQPNTIPLSTLASTGQIWIRDSVGSILAPIMSTGQFQASSITARNVSTIQLQTATLIASTIQASVFQSDVFSASNLSAINIKASSIEVLCMVSTGRFFGDGEFITNLNPAQLNNVIPADKFGYRLIAMDALNPFGDFSYEAGLWTYKQPVTVDIRGIFTVSSIRGDGSQLYNLNYVSTPSLVSTVVGLGSAGYVSTLSLISSLNAAISTFSTAFGPGGISLGNITSTVAGLGTAGYVSSLSTFNLSTQNLFTSTISFLDINDSSRQVLAVSSGVLLLNGLNVGGASASGVTVANLTSTIAGLGTAGYVSTLSLTSSIAGALSSFSTAFGPGGTNMASITSTVAGLGTAGYVSSLSLVSTTLGLQMSGFLSTPVITSTVAGLGTIGYVSTLSLTSSINAALSSFSTAFGPGGTNMTAITSTVAGLGTAGYVSTLSLTSSIAGALSSFSTAFGPGGTNMTAITSTVAGLGTAGYVSTLSLTSSINAALSSFSTAVGPAGLNIITLTSTVTGLGNIYMSTLSVNSSITSYLSSFSTALGAVGTGGVTSIPNNLSTMAIFTSSLRASTITASTIFVSSISGLLSQFTTLSSLTINVSSFYTATRQATPMFITF